MAGLGFKRANVTNQHIPKMKDRLLILALSCSLVGIAAVYFLAASMEPPEVPIWELESHPGEAVKIRGGVERLSVSDNGTVFLTISDSKSSVGAIFFTRQAQKMPEIALLEEGATVCIIGRVSSYKGRTEILGDKLC